jgi:mutator family transposase
LASRIARKARRPASRRRSRRYSAVRGSVARCTPRARRSATPAASSSRCWPRCCARSSTPTRARLSRGLVGDALDRLRKPLPRIAELLEEAEEDPLAFYAFPAEHWPKLGSTNPLERVNREIGRRTDVVGIFPNDRSLIRLAASVVIEQNDEWLVGRRYLSNHSLEAVLDQEKQDKDREETRELTAA